jgi:hypothetical protein
MSSDRFLDAVLAAVAAGVVRVHNVRLGHACNSSSSHSIVIMPREGFLSPDDGGRWGTGFGWEDFCLTEPGPKISYLATLLSNPGQIIGDRMIALDAYPSEYVDHDSVFGWPIGYGRDGEVCVDFIRDFAGFLEHPRVAILGGNDNQRPVSKHERPENLVVETPWTGWTARRDTVGDQSWWVLFNARSGAKLRISMDPAVMYSEGGHERGHNRGRWSSTGLTMSTGLTPMKAATPELVDVKLTDHCTFGCEFCYSGSTRDGQHADPGAVTRLIQALSKLKVFEVAFGGGEPTSWPGLKDAVTTCREVGIVPNLTTRMWSWVVNAEHRDVVEQLGAVALSVTTKAEIERVAKLVSRDSGNRPKVELRLQAIPAILGTEDIQALFDEADGNSLGVTLLGYKPVGRGYSYRSGEDECDADWWVPIWKQSRRTWNAIAIDTTLAAQIEPTLKGEGVPEWAYHTQEGRFSMFVDAVAGMMGPSSYEPEKLVRLDLDADVGGIAEQITTAFAGF